MGFLDNAIKRGIRNAVSSAIGNSVSSAVSSKIGNNAGQSRMETSQSGVFCTKCGANMPSNASFCPKCGTRLQDHTKPPAAAASIDHSRYFSSILSENFGNYEVKTNVPVSSLGTGGTGKPYDFVMYLAGRPAGAIMLTDHNRDNNMAFKNARKACADAKIPFINFYKHFANEKNYVIGRIKGSLL